VTLIDSNIIIYAAKPEHAHLRQFIAENAPSVSAVSYVEVLGYHRLSDQERQLFEAFFASATVRPLSEYPSPFFGQGPGSGAPASAEKNASG
jgi:toxin FitB